MPAPSKTQSMNRGSAYQEHSHFQLLEEAAELREQLREDHVIHHHAEFLVHQYKPGIRKTYPIMKWTCAITAFAIYWKFKRATTASRVYVPAIFVALALSQWRHLFQFVTERPIWQLIRKAMNLNRSSSDIAAQLSEFLEKAVDSSITYVQRLEMCQWILAAKQVIRSNEIKSIDAQHDVEVPFSSDATSDTMLNDSRFPFRLLKLEPGNYDAEIRCSLHHHNFSLGRIYDALSYVWGKEEASTPIIVNEKKQIIQKNLEIALRHLRYRTPNGFFGSMPSASTRMITQRRAL
jgi:hypothetical protein